MSLEKRKHPRVESELKIYAVVKGKRLTLVAKDISMGGVFLATDSILRPGTVLVLEPAGKMGQGPAVVSIAAKVVHFTMLPEFGAGMSWVRAMSGEGMRPLRAWLEEVLDFTIPDEVAHQIPMALWGKPLYWDFRRGRFFVDEAAVDRSLRRQESETSIHGTKVKESLWEQLGKVRVVYSEAPAQKRATVDRDVSIETRADKESDDASSTAKELNRWIHMARKRRPADLQAILQRMNIRLSGRVVGLDGEGLFVEVQHRPPPPGNRIMVDVKLEYQGTTYPVRFICEIDDVLERRDTRMFGLDLRTISVSEGSQRGILRAWLNQK